MPGAAIVVLRYFFAVLLCNMHFDSGCLGILDSRQGLGILMKHLMTVAFGLLVLLSLLAGVAKLFQAPQEVAFFSAAGLGLVPLMFNGIIQVVGSLLSILPKTRLPGLGLVVAGFMMSVLVIAMTGNMPFAAFSMLPVLFGAVVIFLERRKQMAQ